MRLILDRHQVEVRPCLAEGRQLLLDAVGHLHRVRARLLAHGDDDSLLAVEPAVGFELFPAVLHRGDVAHAHRAEGAGDLEVGHIFDRLEVAGRAQQQVLPGLLDAAAGDAPAFSHDGLDDLLRRQVAGLELVGVQQHLDLPLAAAGHSGVGDAIDALQQGQHVARHALADVLPRGRGLLAGDRDAQDGQRRRVVRRDTGFEHIVRQVAAYVGDLLAHVLERALHILVQAEAHDDDRVAFAGTRLHAFDPRRGDHRLLDRFGHLRLDLTGAGARVDGDDRHRREGDIGEEVQRHGGIGDDTHHDQRQHDHGDEYRVPDREIPGSHGYCSISWTVANMPGRRSAAPSPVAFTVTCTVRVA